MMFDVKGQSTDVYEADAIKRHVDTLHNGIVGVILIIINSLVLVQVLFLVCCSCNVQLRFGFCILRIVILVVVVTHLLIVIGCDYH